MNKYARDLRAIKQANSSVTVLTCHDEYLLASMVQGVDGALVGFGSFIPQMIVDLYAAVTAGDLKTAMDLQGRINPLKGRRLWRRRADRRCACPHEDGDVSRGYPEVARSSAAHEAADGAQS
jgi:hypothetical protein